MKKVISSAALSLSFFLAKAQISGLIMEGRIRFERKLNIYSLEGYTNTSAQKDIPQFRTTYFTLSFKNGHTYYEPDKSNLLISRRGEQPAENNLVYIDLQGKTFVSAKQAFEKQIIVADTIPKITWKLTTERKLIAGFECRRANAVILDSIYVVAFYTDAISTSGGPELFCRLPGMILGVVLPHEHISWFATQVNRSRTNETDFLIPTKKGALTNRQLRESLLADMKQWGKQSFFYLMEILL